MNCFSFAARYLQSPGRGCRCCRGSPDGLWKDLCWSAAQSQYYYSKNGRNPAAV